MEHFLTAEETIRILCIRPFHLLGLVREGELHAYAADTGDLIVDADSLKLLPPKTLESCRTTIWSQMRAEEAERYNKSMGNIPDLSSWLKLDQEERWRKAERIYFRLLNPLPDPDEIEVFFNKEGEDLYVDFDAWADFKSVDEIYDRINSLVEDFEKTRREALEILRINRIVYDKQLDRLAEEYYYEQQPWERNVPANCTAVSFSHKSTLEKVMTFLFKEAEIMALADAKPCRERSNVEFSAENILDNSLSESGDKQAKMLSYTDRNTENGNKKRTLTVQERGRRGGSRNKKNMVLVRAIKAAFKKRPYLLEKPASYTLKYLELNVSDSKGDLYFEDKVLMTRFKGKVTSVSKDTFQRYVYEIKKELRTEPTDK